MTTRGSEVAAHGWLAWSIDHLPAGSAASAQELRRRGWSQPIDRPAAAGERLMTAPDPLSPSRRCPHAGRCQAGGATRELDLATYQTPVGVFCATVCTPCVDAGNAPPVRSWLQGFERVGAHCQHLGIDLDQMAALLDRERQGGGDGQG
jgi:hypothetical protein